MEYNAALYDRTQNIQGQMIQTGRALAPLPPANPPVLLQLRRGLAESPAWFLVQAEEFEPEPLSVERLRVRAIWSSERIVSALLELMASEKWLQRSGEEYHLLPEGERLKTELRERTILALRPLETAIQQTNLARFEQLFAQIIEAALHAPTPPGNWSLAHSRRRAPVATESAILKIFYYFSDLNAFRDDAHMAAWRPYGVTGYQWEAFNLLVSGTVRTAAEIYDQIAYRGYALADYQAALRYLIALGWIRERGAGYEVTAAGQTVYDTVEERTNHYFYAAWLALGEAALTEFMTLLETFEQELTALHAASG